MKRALKACEIPAFWVCCVNQGEIDDVIALYDDSAVLMPTFFPHIVSDKGELANYFSMLFSKTELFVVLHEQDTYYLQTAGQGYVVNGNYDFKFNVDGILQTFPSRFTFVVDLGKESPILHHHSSQIPKILT